MAEKGSTSTATPVPSRSGDDSTDSEGESEPIQRVVVIGMDGSSQSEMAFRYYLDSIHRDENRIIFVHAFELPLAQSFQEMYLSPDTWQKTLQKETDAASHMEKRLKGIMEECKIPCKFIARGGKPGDVIVKVAEDESADLIVVGTRGQSRARRTVLGSVSGHVNVNAPCPVLVCRPKRRFSVSSSSRSFTGSFGSASLSLDLDDEEEDEIADDVFEEPGDTRWRFGCNRRQTDSGCGPEPDPSFFADRRVELS